MKYFFASSFHVPYIVLYYPHFSDTMQTEAETTLPMDILESADIGKKSDKKKSRKEREKERKEKKENEKREKEKEKKEKKDKKRKPTKSETQESKEEVETEESEEFSRTKNRFSFKGFFARGTAWKL